jgi:hypothetical protein
MLAYKRICAKLSMIHNALPTPGVLVWLFSPLLLRIPITYGRATIPSFGALGLFGRPLEAGLEFARFWVGLGERKVAPSCNHSAVSRTGPRGDGMRIV